MNKKKKLKTTREIKATLALENEFFKKLNDFSSKVNNSVYYWSRATFNKSFNKNVAKQLQFNFNDLRDYWDKEAKKIGESLSNNFTSKVEKYVKAKFNNENPMFKNIATSKNERNQLTATYERNLNLIKSIPNEKITRYEGVFLNNVNNFNREALYNHFKTISGISKRRAKTIARDQTHKAVINYQSARAESLGFEYYVWKTAGDERVSTGKGGHKYLNNRIYKYSEATAIIDSYGNKGHCGERVNCRCVNVSLYLETGDKLKLVRDSEHGDYYILEKGKKD